MSGSWYSTASPEDELDQGDLLFDCPVVTWRDEEITVANGDDALGGLQAAAELGLTDAIVMTQTCDLAQRHVSVVTLCPHYPLSIHQILWEHDQRSRGQSPTPRSWSRHLDMVKAGQVWNLCMLNREVAPTYRAELRIVNFHGVFTLPRSFLESWLRVGGKQRLRLHAPYREHVSQAFARFFMRVGLPTDIDRTW